MTTLEVINGNHNFEKEIARNHEILIRRTREVNKFIAWKKVILRDESFALDIVKHASWLTNCDVSGNTLAHVAVSGWDSAARLLIENYNNAKKEPLLAIADPRITIAKTKNIKHISVLDLAIKRLNTPLLFRRN